MDDDNSIAKGVGTGSWITGGVVEWLDNGSRKNYFSSYKHPNKYSLFVMLNLKH